MFLRQWMGFRDPWRLSPSKRFSRFVSLWVVPIAVVLVLSFLVAAHP
jgi:hypothetical protein